MVKKKRGKRTPKKNVSIGNKIEMTWRRLALFVILFIFSFVLYSVSSSDLLLNFFGLLSIIFGFTSLALLIVLFVFLILKGGSK
jgi:hypothetical protein